MSHHNDTFLAKLPTDALYARRNTDCCANICDPHTKSLKILAQIIEHRRITFRVADCENGGEWNAAVGHATI